MYRVINVSIILFVLQKEGWKGTLLYFCSWGTSTRNKKNHFPFLLWTNNFVKLLLYNNFTTCHIIFICFFPREEAPIRTGQNGVKRDDREEGEMVSFPLALFSQFLNKDIHTICLILIKCHRNNGIPSCVCCLGIFILCVWIYTKIKHLYFLPILTLGLSATSRFK